MTHPAKLPDSDILMAISRAQPPSMSEIIAELARVGTPLTEPTMRYRLRRLSKSGRIDRFLPPPEHRSRATWHYRVAD